MKSQGNLMSHIKTLVRNHRRFYFTQYILYQKGTKPCTIMMRFLRFYDYRRVEVRLTNHDKSSLQRTWTILL